MGFFNLYFWLKWMINNLKLKMLRWVVGQKVDCTADFVISNLYHSSQFYSNKLVPLYWLLKFLKAGVFNAWDCGPLRQSLEKALVTHGIMIVLLDPMPQQLSHDSQISLCDITSDCTKYIRRSVLRNSLVSDSGKVKKQ